MKRLAPLTYDSAAYSNHEDVVQEVNMLHLSLCNFQAVFHGVH